MRSGYMRNCLTFYDLLDGVKNEDELNVAIAELIEAFDDAILDLCVDYEFNVDLVDRPSLIK